MIYLLIALLLTAIVFNSVSLFKLYKMLNAFITTIQSTHSIEFGVDIQEGNQAPYFKSRDQHGGTISSDQFLNGFSILFVSATCPTCKNIIHKLNTVDDQILEGLIVVSQGTIEEKYVESLSLLKIPYLDDMKIVDDYDVRAVPKLFEVNDTNIIFKIADLNGLDDLKKLKKEREAV